MLIALPSDAAKTEKMRSSFTYIPLLASAPATPTTPFMTTRTSRGDIHADYHDYDDDQHRFLEGKRIPLQDIARMIEKELQVESTSILRGFQGMGSKIERDFQESGEAEMRRIQTLLRQHTKELRHMLRVVSEQLQKQFKTMLKEAREAGNDTGLYEDDLDVMESFTSAFLTDMKEDKKFGEQNSQDESRTGLLSLLWYYMGL